MYRARLATIRCLSSAGIPPGRIIVRNSSPVPADSAGRTIRPSSSIHTAFGMLIML